LFKGTAGVEKIVFHQKGTEDEIKIETKETKISIKSLH
jgi:hypothetical protein